MVLIRKNTASTCLVLSFIIKSFKENIDLQVTHVHVHEEG